MRLSQSSTGPFLAASLYLCLPLTADAADEAEVLVRPENATCIAPERPVSTSEIVLENLITDVRQFRTLDMRYMPDSEDIYAVASRNGYVNLYQDKDPSPEGAAFEPLGEYLDIDVQVEQEYNGTPSSEMGMLGIAFHPDFQSNGYFYVYYSALGTREGSDYESRLSRFTSDFGSLTLDPDTEEVMLRIDHSAGSNHWGGSLFFADSGYLYLTVGDASDPRVSMDTNAITGKILRLDVDSNFPYGIPPDNPYANGGGLPEIYASGFRNPWRGSIDPETGVFWVGDVGHIAWEEINHVQKGGNYGWPTLEGNHCGPWENAETCEVPGSIFPLVELSHDDGASAILGGFVYRGSAIPQLYGKYIYADAGTGGIYVLDEDTQGAYTPRLLLKSEAGYTFSLAQDRHDEILVLAQYAVMRLSLNETVEDDSFPQLLSETGCVAPNDPFQAATGVIPYEVNSPLWSDGAVKQRWMALPDWNGEDARIEVDAEGDWDLPIGTVLMKSFALGDTLVESRLLVRHDDGQWAGYSYEWNDEQSDATLLDGSKEVVVNGQSWTYPDRAQCLQCHTDVAGVSLGAETAQLNRTIHPEGHEDGINQLTLLEGYGMFADGQTLSPSALPALAGPYDDDDADLDARARSYLHANCAMCHQPDGPGQGQLDMRFFVDATSTGLIDTVPFQTDFGIENARLVSPGHPERSVLLERVRTLGTSRMPPLASSLEDVAGTDLLERWIRGYAAPEAGEETVEQPTTSPASPETVNPDRSPEPAAATPDVEEMPSPATDVDPAGTDSTSGGSGGSIDPWTLLAGLFAMLLSLTRRTRDAAPTPLSRLASPRGTARPMPDRPSRGTAR